MACLFVSISCLCCVCSCPLPKDQNRGHFVLGEHRIDTSMVRNTKSELLQNRDLQAFAFVCVDPKIMCGPEICFRRYMLLLFVVPTQQKMIEILQYVGSELPNTLW